NDGVAVPTGEPARATAPWDPERFYVPPIQRRLRRDRQLPLGLCGDGVQGWRRGARHCRLRGGSLLAELPTAECPEPGNPVPVAIHGRGRQVEQRELVNLPGSQRRVGLFGGHTVLE